MFDDTCAPIHAWLQDWMTPAQRMGYVEIGSALRDQIEREAEARVFLEGLGYEVTLRSK